jgi:uncharacterized protein
MKLHLNSAAGLNNISAHGPGYVVVNGSRIDSALIVMPQQLIAPWPLAMPGQISQADFAPLLQLQPEMVVFGSGAQFRFPDPRIAAAFSAKGIGFDVMDTPAACRTYNVLLSEGRNVAAAMLVQERFA